MDVSVWLLANTEQQIAIRVLNATLIAIKEDSLNKTTIGMTITSRLSILHQPLFHLPSQTSL